ncbi:MAG TPA: ABC transporter substrate-binding protein [Chthoniobacterales bacterium]|nr:ABC transporter substrate-binding protein [Chthoniobacterales bacterium]
MSNHWPVGRSMLVHSNDNLQDSKQWNIQMRNLTPQAMYPSNFSKIVSQSRFSVDLSAARKTDCRWPRNLGQLSRWQLPVVLFLCLSALLLPFSNKAQAQEKKKFTVALIPGLTTDAFYITMHKGAQAAADALGVDFVFQGAPEFNPVQQVPVLNAIIGRKPDAILIAPTDKGQLVGPLKKAADSGIPVITVDTFIGDGRYQTGSGDADFPLSYIASDNILGGEIAAKALAKAIGDKGKVYVSNVKPNISTTDQREQGFKQEMKKHPNITVLETQFNDDDANKAASQFQSVYARTPDLAGVFGANLFSATGAANGVKQANAKGKIKVVAFDAPTSMIDDIKAGNIDIAIAQHPAEIGFYGVVTAYAHLTGQSVPPLIGTGFTVIDKSNIDDPKVKKFIYSD